MKYDQVQIIMDTLVYEGDNFSLDNVVGFSVENIGNADVFIGYEGRGHSIEVPVGKTRVFNLHAGLKYFGKMVCKFKDSQTGLIKITKHVLSTIQS